LGEQVCDIQPYRSDNAFHIATSEAMQEEHGICSLSNCQRWMLIAVGGATGDESALSGAAHTV
jgi:hypothetical protein